MSAQIMLKQGKMRSHISYRILVELLSIEEWVDPADGNCTLDERHDAKGQQEQGSPHGVEQGQGNKGCLAVKNVVDWINEDVCHEGGQSHQQRGAAPHEVLRPLQELEDLQLVDLLLPQAVDPLDEGEFPGVQLEDLDAIEDLWY